MIIPDGIVNLIATFKLTVGNLSGKHVTDLEFPVSLVTLTGLCFLDFRLT